MLIVILICVLIVALYYYATRNNDYWRKKGVAFEEPMFLFGSSLRSVIDGISVSERFSNLYRSYPHEKFVGFFEGTKPELLLRDPQMIKRVMQADFKSFPYRGLLPEIDNVEPLMKNLFSVDGDIWKLMRQKLTPMFSSGKLKGMFYLISERAERLTATAEEFSRTKDEVDVRELMARYTTDVIGAVGFGIDSEALNSEDSKVRRLGKRIFTLTKRDIAVGLTKKIFPALSRNLNFVAPEIERQTVSLVTHVMAQRKYKPSGSNDFIDLLLELRKKEVIVGDSINKTNVDGSPMQVELEIDDLLLAAQVFVFFAAGYETSSHASSFVLHLLAHHSEKQARCQKEIDEILKANNGKLSFEGVKEMKYLEICIKEALRLLPSPGFVTRKSSSKYTFPDTNVTIDENLSVVISIDSLHNDEQYFERASEFWPERFDADNEAKFDKDAYMPFGAGPRACIGERLGLLQSMTGVAAILSKFTVSPSKNTLEKPAIDKNSVIAQNILGGLPLSLKRRN